MLHAWVTTVDHKKIGLMYIGYALVFLVIAGLEAMVMRLQLAVPENSLVSPQVFNRMFTMHGTTMVFFVGMPILFGFGNYLIPLMLGARDMAFPRLNAFSFWIAAFGGLLLYFSFLGGDGLYGAGTAPDVGWFAYAPLTAKVFSPGHSTDYWTLGILLSGIGSIGTALNIVTTIICMRCPGMKLSRMPLLVWLYFVTCCMVFVAVSPLTAAQIMLLIDRYLGGHFFDTQAGGSAVLWMHFFWIFGHPEVYILVLPAFGFANEIIPVFSRKAIFGYPAMVAATVAIGFISLSVWAHHMFTVGLGAGSEYILYARHDDHRRSHWNQNLQLDSDALGRQHPLHRRHAVLCRVPVPISGRRPYRHHAGRFAVRLAAQRIVFRGGALPLCPGGSDSLHHLRRLLLLVSQDVRPDAGRDAGQVAFLAFPDRFPSHFRFHAHPWRSRDAAPDLYL